MNKFLTPALVLLLSLTARATTAAAAAPTWTMTTAEFEKQRVELRELRGDALVVVPTGTTTPVELPLARFLGLTRLDVTATADKAGLTLHLLGGGTLVGTPVRVEGDSVVWRTASVGEVPASLRQAVGITRAGQPLPRNAEPSNQDRVRLANGDVVEGVIADASEEAITVQSPGGDAVAVPIESIAHVAFAAGVQEEPKHEQGFQVRLTDGSAVPAKGMTLADGRLRFELAGAQREVPVEAVRSIEQVNGPVTWLSDLSPTENVQTPFMGSPIPARFNETLDGKPITFGGQRFGKGIAVHSYSKLTYDLTGGDYTGFRTQYAIDGPREKADVTVRVIVDGRVVHERSNVVAGALSPVVTAELKGAKTLTLEVDYGQTYDVQDRVLWIEAALVR